MIFASLLLLAGFPTAAQGFLPPSFSGWNSTNVMEARPADLPKLAGENAAPLQEYGLLVAEQRTYARGAGNLSVTLYRMKDPSAAYGAYSFLRAPEMTPPKITEHSSASHDRALILIGNLVLDVSAKEVALLHNDLAGLAAQLGPRADMSSYPTLALYMPEEGRVSRSDRYILGPTALNRLLPVASDDWLGFSNGAEAELARYRAHGEDLTLVMAEYPTPQLATKQMAELGKRFNLNPPGEQANAASDARPALFARQSSALIAIVLNARSNAAAEALLIKVKYTQDLTWNEPTFAFTQPNWGTYIVGIITGTGTLCLFALISGVAFGGIRVVVKRFFPGKIFDRPNHVEILQLGLTSKPIEAKDFY